MRAESRVVALTCKWLDIDIDIDIDSDIDI